MGVQCQDLLVPPSGPALNPPPTPMAGAGPSSSAWSSAPCRCQSGKCDSASRWPDTPAGRRRNNSRFGAAGRPLPRRLTLGKRSGTADAVAKLLGCSVNWAEKLARPLKAKLRAARDAAILAGKDEGKSNREIAREVGVPHVTVDRVVSAPNPPQGGNEAPPPGPVLAPDPPVWRQQLEVLSSGPARNWSSALRALRHINEQIPIDELCGASGVYWRAGLAFLAGLASPGPLCGAPERPDGSQPTTTPWNSLRGSRQSPRTESPGQPGA
jgi:hypothetical protein